MSISVSGKSLSLFGRSALANVGDTRTSARPQLDPVSETDPTKDPTSSEYRELAELKQRDREVRQHEQAHIAAGGAHVRGGASFSYETGPDGKRYATGGEVSIDTSTVSGDPAATIRKMEIVRAAATAPAEPSAQDRAVAAEAAQKISQARVELLEERQAEAREGAVPARARGVIDAYRGAADAGAADTGAAPLLDMIA